MSHILAVFLIWFLSLFGIQNCEPVSGFEALGICIEIPADPPPAPPPEPEILLESTVAISNGF
jgi:hypothetical protein